MIASVEVSSDDANNTKGLRLVVDAAKAALGEEGDPMCEVLR
jgi:hypothetical protein